jgi:hypothetical protein
MKQNLFQRTINIYGAITTPAELIIESLINFMWGFFANSIVVFVSKDMDTMVLINFIVYYTLVSYIFNRKKYETKLGKFVVLPVSSSIGAFVGYKIAQIISVVI